jgi:2-methylcitrate dehydratase PrpD
MITLADSLARWAVEFEPTPDDLALAQRALLDTTAVTLAAREHPLRPVVDDLPDAARWASMGHVLDFDDLHIQSTAHISVVVVPAVLAMRGDARAYLAGAGVMARLGIALGWKHYGTGWHATCTSGAPAAAVAAGTAMGLSERQLVTAMALAIPAAGGVQRAFGTHSKALQVGFAAAAGVRAARLARAGATAEPAAMDHWLELVGGSPTTPDLGGPAVPGGLAIKVYPCCYAMQRPIAALRQIRHQLDNEVTRVHIRTPKDTVQPLIHDLPRTGLEGKFSLPYAVATALLDEYPDFASFTGEAVNRPRAQRLLERVDVEHTPGTGGLLVGEVDIEIELADGRTLRTTLADPPGAPSRPPTAAEFRDKLTACGEDVPALLANPDWQSMAELMHTTFPGNEKANT